MCEPKVGTPPVTDHDSVIVERKHAVLSITLNRPTAANSLSADMVEQVITAIEQIDDARLCVIRGNGKHFCAGFDLANLNQSSDGDLLWRLLRIEHMLQLIHHAKVPMIAFAHGKTVGAGADIFAACWQRIASNETVFSMPGWNFELALGTRRLTRLLGAQFASEMLIETRNLDALSALDIGLVTNLAEPAEFADIIDRELQRTSLLSSYAVHAMLDITRTDTREADIAAIVQTAGRPGLRDRITAYREHVIGQKKPAPKGQ